MANCYKHAIDSIESVQKIVGGSSTTPLLLNERQCQLVAKELSETSTFLENNNVCLKSDQAIQHITLFQLYSAIKRAELLVKKCCCKDSESWLVAAMMLVEIQEEFATIILDIHLWRMVLDIAIASALGLSREQKVEQLMKMDEKYHGLFKDLRRDNHKLQQAALEDERIILLRIAEVHGSPNDLEYLRAVYMQSLLTHSQVGTGNAASIVKQLKEYKFLHVLGKGGCGMVFEVTWLGVRCALKILNVQDEREATALKGLFHPNIIRLFHYWEAPFHNREAPLHNRELHNLKSHLLMELMPTDLGVYIEGRLKSMPSSALQTGKDIMPFPLPVAIDIMEQIAHAMQYLHDKHLTHRDLKPSNILVKERENVGLTTMDGEGYLDIKLADFGLARAYNNTSTTQAHTVNTGTPIYGAPEIFGKDLALERNFLPMADVWSFGITCAEILSGKKPYADEPRETLQRRIFKEGLRPTLPKHCPQYLAFCISSCWELLPERRPNFGSICKLLRHAKLLSLEVTDLDDSELFFAYTTRSGHVKGLRKSKTSMGERFSTFLRTLLQYVGSGAHSIPTIVEGKSGSMISSSTITNNAGTSLDLESVNQDRDVDIDEGDDPIILVPDDVSVKSSLGSLLESTTLAYKSESMISNSFAMSEDSKSSDLRLPTRRGSLLQEGFDVDKGGDHLIVIPDDGMRSLSSATWKRHPTIEVHQGPLGPWVRGEYLGTGPYATVYEGVSNTGLFFAVKEFYLSDQWEFEQVEAEMTLLSKIQHPNIVRYLGTAREKGKRYIFTELVKMGSLVHVYNRYELFYDQIREYTKQILCGLKYLHDLSIAHRDIKCAHILVDTSGVVKLSDFGMNKQLHRLTGSIPWMAPEAIISHSGNNGMYSKLYADIWSLGCTVLEMATRKPPFGKLDDFAIILKVQRGEAPFIPDDLEEDLKDFISKCLQVNPAHRPTSDILLTHPFITGSSMSGAMKIVPTTEPS